MLISVCQAAAPPTAAAKNAMALETVYPDMSTALKAIRNNEKELAAYLSDPDTVCTLFVPTNQVSCSGYSYRAVACGYSMRIPALSDSITCC